MASDKRVVGFVSMWPREICDVTIPERKGRLFIGEFEDLEKPGVYVLYRNDQPYYIGKAERLASRIHDHSNKTTDPYFNFWNFFSAFVVADKRHIGEVETILIAAMPTTANSSTPHIHEIKLPQQISAQMRAIRRHAINPVTQQDFLALRRQVLKVAGRKSQRKHPRTSK